MASYGMFGLNFLSWLSIQDKTDTKDSISLETIKLYLTERHNITDFTIFPEIEKNETLDEYENYCVPICPCLMCMNQRGDISLGSDVFNIKEGINKLVPDALYSGTILDHTETEYNNLIWNDDRQKPSWEDVNIETLILLRKGICINIDKYTKYNIKTQFACSIEPDKLIETTSEWQFDVLNLFLQKDSGIIQYPYDLHIGQNDLTGEPSYITLTTSDDLQQLYLEIFNHINIWLASGRQEKAHLQTLLTRTELENYQDPR